MVTEWKSAYQETIEMAEEKGRQEGRQEGREEGRYDGERAALAIVLKARFGDLTLDTTAKLEAVIPETLERWLAAAATARTLEEALS